MVAVFLNLNVNLARILLANLKNEVNKVVHKFDAKGLLREFNVKKRLNFCTKISLIILANYEQAKWDDLVEFDISTKIPPPMCGNFGCR